MPKSALRELNVKAGMPTVDEARRILLEGLRTAKSGGVRVVKVIHGYGSSGAGAARSSFRSLIERAASSERSSPSNAFDSLMRRV